MTQNLFFGEHFEGLGDIWDAYFGEKKDENDIGVFNFVPDVIQNGKLAHAVKTEDDSRNAILFYVHKPSKTSPVGFEGASILNSKSKHLEFASIYPIFDASASTVRIQDIYAWGNGVEGEVAVSYEGSEQIIGCFLRDFAVHFPKLSRGSLCRMELSALAFSLKKSSNEPIILNSGKAYEFMLQEFLAENPGKTRSDFPSAEVCLDGSVMLFPTGYASELEYRLPVESVEPFEAYGVKGVKIGTTFSTGAVNGNSTKGTLYATEFVYGDYIPQVGDDIQGIMWMTANIVDTLLTL